MNKNRYFEVIKEFIIQVPDVDFDIHARIKKEITTKNDIVFFWEVSHYYKQESNSPLVYKPSNHCAGTIVECERILFMYLNKFTNIDIQANEDY